MPYPTFLNRFRTAAVLTLVLSLLVLPCHALTPSEELRRILQREWDHLMAENPIMAIYLGGQSARLWPDNSKVERRSQTERYRRVIQELDALDKARLSEAEQLNRRLFRQQLQWQISRHELGLDLFTMNQRDGLHTTATLTDSMTFRQVSDYELWTRRLEAFPDYVSREIGVLEEAIERGRVHPRIIVERLLERVEIQPEECARGRESAFFAPFQEAPARVKEDPRFPALAARAERAIADGVGPSFTRLGDFLRERYLTAAPPDVGLGRLPQGQQAYQFLIRRYTTTDLTADEIHAIGLREVARIRGEMEAIKEQVGFAGTLEEFFAHLRSDPKHYCQDPEELLRRYRSFCKRVDGKMPELFETLPRKPYGVEAIPDYIAPATTTAYYLPGAGPKSGTYFVNLYKPETRALFEIPALSLHESVPGHHHQIALAGELPDLPEFRRRSDGFGDYTVFVEGWALYAESLGEEMGLYDDPYDRFGRYTYEIWRAIRLVLDTGIHSKGWSRDQAITYFLDNSPRSELDITNEVDRYIAWPGQALAYKMGELKITELRRRAERELGSKFRLRSFHEAVLSEGAVPLDQLERQVEAFLSSSASSGG